MHCSRTFALPCVRRTATQIPPCGLSFVHTVHYYALSATTTTGQLIRHGYVGQSALAPTMYPPPWGWVTTSLLSETAPQLPKEALSSDTTLRMYRLTHAQCSCESFYASKIVRSLPLLPTLVSCTGVVPWLMYRQVSAIRKENMLICGTHTYNGGCR